MAMQLMDRIAAALESGEGYPKVILEPLLAETEAEEIAASLPVAGEQRWILRKHLQERWGWESSAYQRACFFELVENLAAGKRVTSETMAPDGTLNLDVLAEHIDASDKTTRLAAVQVAREAHLELLVARLKVETDPEVVTAIETRGARLAGLRGAPSTPLLVGEARIVCLARQFLQDRARWVSWPHLAEVLACPVDSLRVALEPLADPDARTPRGKGFSVGPRGVRYFTGDVWNEGQDHALDGDFEALEAFLATLEAGKAPRGITLPELHWANGAVISDHAARLRLSPPRRESTNGDAVLAAIDFGLHPRSVEAFVRWWREDKKRQKNVPLPGVDASYDTLVDTEGLKGCIKRLPQASTATDRGAQLLFLAMKASSSASKRNEWSNMLQNQGGLLDALVDVEPSFVDRDTWTEHLRELVEGWLRAQAELWLPDLRHWHGVGSFGEALAGAVFRAGERLVPWEALLDADIDANTLVTLAHPADVPPDAWPATTPSWQRDRPVYTESDLPERGPQSAEVSFRDWTARTHSLGYMGIATTGGGVAATARDSIVTLHHNGHGSGYGGKGPQRIHRLELRRKERAVVSEVVWDVRRIVGVDPM